MPSELQTPATTRGSLLYLWPECKQKVAKSLHRLQLAATFVKLDRIAFEQSASSIPWTFQVRFDSQSVLVYQLRIMHRPMYRLDFPAKQIGSEAR